MVSFIDIGTNAIRLLVVRLDRSFHRTVVTQQREPARLGDGEFVTGRLQVPAMDRGVLVCKKFAELSRAHGAKEIVAVATSATRVASNGEEFLRRLRTEAGIDAHVISGREEARLVYQGLASHVHLGGRKALFVDIGGGSTEIIVGGQHSHTYLDSIGLGAVRLTSLHVAPNEASPVSPAAYQELRHHARMSASNTINNVRTLAPDLALGVSGTIQNLCAIAARTRGDESEDGATMLSLSELRRVTAMLCALPLQERQEVPGLNPDRADVIVGGAAILDVLMEELGFSEIVVLSEGGLRDGLLIDYVQQHSGHATHGLSVRDRSILDLGHACKFDETHARNAQRLALELFDSARDAGLHSHEDWERDLLGYVALLHDIGSFLSYNNHHVHSSYLIGNSELLGFYRAEIELMSLAALFHRKGLPTSREPRYAALDRETRQTVAFLSLLIRLVESLDRSHQGVVEHARLSASSRRDLCLTVEASRDAQLELWGIESRKRAVLKTLKRHLRIVLNGEPYLMDFAKERPPSLPEEG